MSAVVQNIQSGGPVVWVLIILSVVALSLVLQKLWQFRHLLASAQLADDCLQHLHKGQSSQARLLIRGARSPRAQLLTQCLGVADQSGMDQAAMRQEMLRLAKARLADMGQGLRPLEIIATSAPLLGLLGTVLGMIEAFQAMEQAGRSVDPAVLSGGIWQALLTTAMGLAVAIPVSALHAWLERMIEVQAGAFEDDLQQLMTLMALRPAALRQKTAVS